MNPFRVVEPEVGAQTLKGIFSVAVILQVDLFIFYRPPQPLDKDIVHGPPTAVHADPDAPLLQDAGPVFARELRSLIGVEDLRAADPERFLQGFDAEPHVERVG